MVKLLSASALILAMAALPLAACPYSKGKADQSAQGTPPTQGQTIILKPKASS